MALHTTFFDFRQDRLIWDTRSSDLSLKQSPDDTKTLRKHSYAAG
ncbi:MAG: hypothetical protein U0892_05345 [Pirellulales bacterium]